MAEPRYGIEALDGFSTDEYDNLFYNKKRIVTKLVITFSAVVNWAMIASVIVINMRNVIPISSPDMVHKLSAQWILNKVVP